MKNAVNYKQISAVLDQGGTLFYPTETIFGIGADALNPKAVEAAYQLKVRDPEKPMLCLVGAQQDLQADFDISAEELQMMKKVWPGGFTFLLKPTNPALFHLKGPTGRVGVRSSDHPFLQSLFEHWSGYLLSSSANLSGEPYSGDADVLRNIWLSKVDYFVDESCYFEDSGGQPSTLVVYENEQWHTLRQGDGVLPLT